MTDVAVASGAGTIPGRLSERLGLAQRRAVLRRTLLGVVVAANAGLVAFIVLGAGYLLAGRPASWLFATVDPNGTGLAGSIGRNALGALVLGVVVFLGRAVADRRAQGGLAGHARAADRSFAGRERFSTALEVAGDPRGLSAVARALLDDVEDRAAAIDPRALVSLRLPPSVIAGTALSLFLAAAILVALSAARGATPPAAMPDAPPPAILAEPERAEVVEEIRRVAAALAEDAERRDDAYLGAIARELERLGETLVAEPAPDRADIAADLARLRANTADAYDRAGEAAGGAGNLTRLMDEALRDLAEGPRDAVRAAAAEPGTPPAPAEAGTEGALPDGRGPDGAGTPPAPPGVLPTAPPPPTGAGETDDLYELEARNVAAAEAQRRAARNQQQPGELAAAVPIGAAADAGIGEGDMAGRGVRPLDAGVVTEFATPPAIEGEMILEDGRAGDGRRLRVEAPPEGQAAAALAAGELTDGRGWRRLPEQEVTRTPVRPEDAGVLVRYFGAEGRAR